MRPIYEEPKRGDETPVSRAARRVFAWLLTIFCIGMSIYMAFTGMDGVLAEIVVRELMGIAVVTVMFYIGGSILDRSNVLGNMGGRFGGTRNYYQQPYRQQHQQHQPVNQPSNDPGDEAGNDGIPVG